VCFGRCFLSLKEDDDVRNRNRMIRGSSFRSYIKARLAMVADGCVVISV